MNQETMNQLHMDAIEDQMARFGTHAILVAPFPFYEWLPFEEKRTLYNVTVVPPINPDDFLAGGIFRTPSVMRGIERTAIADSMDFPDNSTDRAMLFEISSMTIGAMKHNPITAIDLNSALWVEPSAQDLVKACYAHCISDKYAYLGNALSTVQMLSRGVGATAATNVLTASAIIPILYMIASVYDHHDFAGPISNERMVDVLKKIAISPNIRNGHLLLRAFEEAMTKGSSLSNATDSMVIDGNVSRIFFNNVLMETAGDFINHSKQQTGESVKPSTDSLINLERLTIETASAFHPEIDKIKRLFY